MTIEELSNEFDVLLNSYKNKLVFGEQDGTSDINLNEYEKSVFLTSAQNDVLLSIYRGTNTYALSSFDSNEETKRLLNDFIKEAELVYNEEDDLEDYGKYTLPSDVLFILYESVYSRELNKYVEVVPTTYDELHKIRRNPFRGPNKHRILRLDAGGREVPVFDEDGNIFDYDHISEVALVALSDGKDAFSIDNYNIKYISKPDPIILENLPEGLSINGKSTQTSLNKKFNYTFYKMVLERAVQLALSSRVVTSAK